MINAIESEFSYEVDMGEVEKIKTVGDIIGILETETSKTGIHERH
jgi:acyl carrier protein